MAFALGALALLYAQRQHPGTFQGLFLQSGSFFMPRFDAHESSFPHYHRVVGFVSEALRRGYRADVPVVLVMSNTPVLVDEAMSVISSGRHASEPHLRRTEELLAPILESTSGLTAGTDFALGYSPERIDPGNRTWTFETTPKVVSGLGPTSLAAVQAFYDRLVDQTVAVTSPKEAELTKLLENTFRHVNIALVNEMAVLCHDLGVDI